MRVRVPWRDCGLEKKEENTTHVCELYTEKKHTHNHVIDNFIYSAARKLNIPLVFLFYNLKTNHSWSLFKYYYLYYVTARIDIIYYVTYYLLRM